MKIPDFEYKFHFGAKKLSTTRRIIVGVGLGILVDILSGVLKVKQSTIWALIDDIGRTFKIRDINELVLSNSNLLEARIERDVDAAIEEYNKETDEPKDTSVFTETLEGDTPLGGEMRRTANYVVDMDR